MNRHKEPPNKLNLIRPKQEELIAEYAESYGRKLAASTISHVVG